MTKKCILSHTVLSFKAFPLGIVLLGAHPHPANRPPGVWNNLKPSPSPTLVTVPNNDLFLQKDVDIRVAPGMRLRYDL